MKMHNFFILISLLFSFYSHAQFNELSASEKDEFIKGIPNLATAEYIEDRAYKPSNIKDDLIGAFEGLYLDGYTTKAGYQQIKCKVDELFKIEQIITDTGHPANRECVFLTISNSCVPNPTINNYNDPTCDNSGNVMIGPIPKTIPTGNGTKVVTKHYDVWTKIYDKVARYAISVVEANREKLKNERENATVAKCNTNLIRDIEYRELTGSCKKANESCSDHTGCCSGMCLKSKPSDATGSCSPAYTCYKEIAVNNTCGKFPDGFINNHCKDSSCIKIDFNSSDIGEFKKDGEACSNNNECRSDKCVNNRCETNFMCKFCAQNGETPAANKECCPGLIKSENNKCIPSFPPLILPFVKSLIKKIGDQIFPSAYAQSCVPGVNCAGSTNNPNALTAEQIFEIQRRTQQCLQMGSQEARQACLDDVAALKASYMQAIEDGTWDRETYLEKYNAMAISSKTYSDIQNCKFNSFNDTWRDMSNVQRNAEMVTRGFEYVYTGAGTEDYWVNSEGKNIFSRAKAVATKLRKNRSEMIKKMQEADIRMACQCIAIYGPEKFPDRMEFFNSPLCADAREAMGGMDIDNVDGSSQSQNTLEAEEGQIAEIDLGATGISHERILLQWLTEKQNLQFDRFTANQEVEEDMRELVQYIVEDTDWEKGKMVETKLYDFTLRKMSGWFAIFIAIVVVAAAIAVVYFAGIAFTVFGSQIAFFASYAVIAAGIAAALWGKDHGHHFNDQVRQDWHCINWLCTHKDKDLTRWYVGPHYKNFQSSHGGFNISGLSLSLRCDVRSTSSQCFKNAYKTMFQEEGRFLLDLKKPLFVESNAYSLDIGHVAKINQAFLSGIFKLKGTNPGRTNPRFMQRNFLAQKEFVDAFLPNTQVQPFSDTMKGKVLAAVKKFAKCKDLVECGASANDYEGDLGFGYLFESDEDVANFGEYVYQHHFHWPSLTASNFLGYPLMAQRAYFEILEFNIKLVGSLAVAQGVGYGDAYDRYKADWDKRKSAYDALGKVKLGHHSQNANYRTEFRSTFKELNFSTGAGLSSFDKLYEQGRAAGKFNKSELAALAAGRNKAIAGLNSQKKLANYKKQTLGSARAELKENAQTAHMNKISVPLNSSGLTVGGRNLGNTGNMYAKGGSLTKAATEKSSKGGKATPSFKAPVIASYKPMPTSSYGTYSSPEYNADEDKSELKTKNMSQEEIDRMLTAIEKNKRKNRSNDNDNLFTAVSKAYKRNYDVFFSRRKLVMPEVIKAEKNNIDDKKKKELKKLLDN